MVVGESRKSRRFREFKDSRDASCFRRSSNEGGCGTWTKNTNLNGLASFIMRNVPNNATSKRKREKSLCQTTKMSSENTEDVIVENTSLRNVERPLGSP